MFLWGNGWAELDRATAAGVHLIWEEPCGTGNPRRASSAFVIPLARRLPSFGPSIEIRSSPLILAALPPLSIPRPLSALLSVFTTCMRQHTRPSHGRPPVQPLGVPRVPACPNLKSARVIRARKANVTNELRSHHHLDAHGPPAPEASSRPAASPTLLLFLDNAMLATDVFLLVLSVLATYESEWESSRTCECVRLWLSISVPGSGL